MSKIYEQLSNGRWRDAIKNCRNVGNFFRIGISLAMVGGLLLGALRRPGEALNRLLPLVAEAPSLPTRDMQTEDTGSFANAPQRKVPSLNLKDTITESGIAGYAAFSPRGNVLAALKKQTVQLWDLEASKVKLTLSGHKETMGVYFSPDGDTVITFGRDKSLNTKLWDSKTGLLRATLDGFDLFGTAHLNALWPMMITVAGGRLEFWNAETGELKKTVKAHGKIYADSRFFFDSVISPNGRLVVRYGGKKALLWETETGKLKAELTPPKDNELFYEYRGRKLEIDHAQFSPDAQTVATRDSYNRIELWDVQTGQLKATLVGHLDSIYNLEFSADSQLLATASRDGTARVWDVKAGRLKDVLKAGKQIARRVEFSPDDTVLAVGYQNRVRLWKVNTGQLIAELPEDKEVSTTTFFGTYLHGIELRFSPDGRLLLTMSDKTVKAWDAKTGTFIATLENARPPAAFSSNGQFLATAGRDKSVLLWEISTR